jgi:hypothetical protein
MFCACDSLQNNSPFFDRFWTFQLSVKLRRSFYDTFQARFVSASLQAIQVPEAQL